MTKFVIAWLACTLALVAGCNVTNKPSVAGTEKPDTPPGISPEIQALATRLLGSGAEVLAAGNLARNGPRQALLVNRLANSPQGLASRVLFTRAAVLEQEGSNWNEVLRCDEYLKNPKGFLDGTPRVPIATWQLQFSSPAPDGRIGQLTFTPLPTQGDSRFPSIAVRWNPKAGRYQSFDAATEQFLGEMEMLEIPRAELK